MGAQRPILEKLITIMPRAQLEEYAKDVGEQRPWNLARRDLEVLLITHDSAELRHNIMDWIDKALSTQR